MAIKKKEEKVEATLKDYKTILGPVITEKASHIGGENTSGVVLKVDRRATKTEIKEAVEKVFDVKVAKVRTCNYLGKAKRMGRSSGRRAAFKKAYINFKEGHDIDLYEGI